MLLSGVVLYPCQLTIQTTFLQAEFDFTAQSGLDKAKACATQYWPKGVAVSATGVSTTGLRSTALRSIVRYTGLNKYGLHRVVVTISGYNCFRTKRGQWVIT